MSRFFRWNPLKPVGFLLVISVGNTMALREIARNPTYQLLGVILSNNSINNTGPNTTVTIAGLCWSSFLPTLGSLAESDLVSQPIDLKH